MQTTAFQLTVLKDFFGSLEQNINKLTYLNYYALNRSLNGWQFEIIS
jgi:hypothetical protein